MDYQTLYPKTRNPDNLVRKAGMPEQGARSSPGAASPLRGPGAAAAVSSPRARPSSWPFLLGTGFEWSVGIENLCSGFEILGLNGRNVEGLLSHRPPNASAAARRCRLWEEPNSQRLHFLFRLQ